MGFVMNTAIAINLGANLFTMKTDLPARVIIVDFLIVGTYYLGKHRNIEIFMLLIFEYFKNLGTA